MKTVIESVNNADGLDNLFKDVGKTFAKAGEKLTRKSMENPGRFQELGAKLVALLYLKELKTLYRLVKLCFFIMQEKVFILENLYR